VLAELIGQARRLGARLGGRIASIRPQAFAVLRAVGKSR
jgi:hypothetical protein